MIEEHPDSGDLNRVPFRSSSKDQLQQLWSGLPNRPVSSYEMQNDGFRG
jgi:hypothetical protein